MHALFRPGRSCRRAARVPRLSDARHASGSANPYPYPASTNPTPHQIFHLPPSASQKDIKARYYELVRIYHPDSPVARVYPPEVSEARFHAISASYDALRGRRATLDPDAPDAPRGSRVDLHALWRARQRQRRDPLGPSDERWKDGVIVGMLLLTLGAFVYQTASARQRSVGEALQTYQRAKSEARVSRQASSHSRDVHLLSAPDPDPGSAEDSAATRR